MTLSDLNADSCNIFLILMPSKFPDLTLIFIEDDIENNGTKNTEIGTELYYSIENKIVELLKKTEEAI